MNNNATQLIDTRIKDLDDWRGEVLAWVRKLIQEADPEIVAEMRWRMPSNAMSGVPVWEHNGSIARTR